MIENQIYLFISKEWNFLHYLRGINKYCLTWVTADVICSQTEVKIENGKNNSFKKS
jgi:hypothetical protein